MPEPRVGEIWDIDLDSRIGNGQGGIQPTLIVSGADFNAIPYRLRIVIPITGTDKGLSNQVRIPAPEGGLTKASDIMCE